MEDLTKTQLILLALLVSFVTSIATGIVTVSLVDQAPPGVTQTINRVVERTVERVVPGQAASVVTKETTVVIKEENLIIDAVEKNSKNMVRIGLADGDGNFSGALGVGVIISTSGTIATDSLNLTESKEYLIKTSNDKTYKTLVRNFEPLKNIAILEIVQPEEGAPVKFSKPSFGETGNLRLGQTVVAIGGLVQNEISTGVISKVNKETLEIPSEEENDKESSTKTTEVLKSIESSASLSPDYSGGPLVDVDGFLLGINLQRKDGSFSVPINLVLDIISQKLENQGNQEVEQS